MVSDSTLIRDVWTAVKDILVAASPSVVAENLTYTYTAPVRASYNDKQSDRPQIIVNSANEDEDSYKFGSSYGKRMVNITVDIYAQNGRDMDILYGEVVEALVSTTISGVELVARASDTGFSTAADGKYNVKSVTFTYDRE